MSKDILFYIIYDLITMFILIKVGIRENRKRGLHMAFMLVTILGICLALPLSFILAEVLGVTNYK